MQMESLFDVYDLCGEKKTPFIIKEAIDKFVDKIYRGIEKNNKSDWENIEEAIYKFVSQIYQSTKKNNNIHENTNAIESKTLYIKQILDLCDEKQLEEKLFFDLLFLNKNNKDNLYSAYISCKIFDQILKRKNKRKK